MKKELYKTETEKNLLTAIQGEALAHFRYQVYAKLLGKISKDIENKINEISHNEKEHGKIWMKLLLQDDYADNDKNLFTAITGEQHEGQSMYPEFARIAREEGFDEIAEKFEQVAEIENHHAEMFQSFLDDINNINISKTINTNEYKCLNCGYIHHGSDIPDICPVCAHPKEYFVSVD